MGIVTLSPLLDEFYLVQDRDNPAMYNLILIISILSLSFSLSSIEATHPFLTPTCLFVLRIRRREEQSLDLRRPAPRESLVLFLRQTLLLLYPVLFFLLLWLKEIKGESRGNGGTRGLLPFDLAYFFLSSLLSFLLAMQDHTLVLDLQLDFLSATIFDRTLKAVHRESVPFEGIQQLRQTDK